MFDPSKEYEDLRRPSRPCFTGKQEIRRGTTSAFLSSPAGQGCHGQRARNHRTAHLRNGGAIGTMVEEGLLQVIPAIH